MTECTTPVGRIVWGHPGRARQKTHIDGAQKGQPVLRDGQPVQQWSFGVAFAKADFEQHIWPVMAAEIATGYPNGVPPRFSYKYVDGDGTDNKGVPFANREGYAGCYVLAITTEAFAPPIYKFNPQTGKYDQLTEDQIKTGDHVRVGLNFKVNVATGTLTPSIYVNPVAVEFVAFGAEIHNGPDAATLFGGVAPQVPPGASTTPVTSSGVGMPGMGQAPVAQGGMPAPAPVAPMQHPSPVQPAHDFVNQAGQQPAQPQAPAPQPMPPQPAAPAPGAMPGTMPPRT